ncbi:MAG: GNAT family N-acetyltransferase [Syntrophaceae bacterium]|nr:GNAT family N-acetyltransferase [Syntrophaceae bacterium]
MSFFKKFRTLFKHQTIKIYSFNTDFRTPQSISTNKKRNLDHIKTATLHDIEELHQRSEMKLGYHDFKSLLKKIEENTWHCVISKTDGQITGYGFFSTVEMNFHLSKKISFILPPSTGYFFNLFVHPDFRNRSLGKYLTAAIMEIIQEMGYQITLTAVDKNNKVQIRNVQKMGGEFLGSIVLLKVRSFYKIMISKKLKKVNIEFNGIFDY